MLCEINGYIKRVILWDKFVRSIHPQDMHSQASKCSRLPFAPEINARETSGPFEGAGVKTEQRNPRRQIFRQGKKLAGEVKGFDQVKLG